MKKSRKIVLGATAIAALVAGGVTTFLATAWGDSGGGRPSYTIDQINQGVLGDKIVFNSISNSVIGDEKNFVGARVDDGDHGTGNVWHGNDIDIENGKTYIIRLYVHNNNPKGEKAVAENVRTSINVPSASSKTVEVNGFIDSSNATPDAYWDYVRFHSNSNFHLEYVKGSALLENNGIGAHGGIQLSDNVVTQNGTLIGYNALDGRIPGCYQYASYVTIKVKAVVDNEDFKVDKEVRKAGETTDWRANWSESVKANIGDEVEYRIHYKNTTSAATENVMVKDILPANQEYVNGTTMLYNATNPQGIARDDTITTTGVNIGGYAVNGDGYVIFKAKVKDDSLNCGDNTLVNWGQVGVGQKTLQDPANVVVNKPCSTGFTTKKQVRIGGTGDWQDSVKANVGDEVEYRISYQNTGNTKATNVKIKDTLPANVEFVPGSAKLYNATKSGEAVDDTIVTTGVNIGDYEAGQTAYVTFKAKVADKSLNCGNNKLTNVEETSVGTEAKQSKADVDVEKACSNPQPTPTPENPVLPETMPTTGPTEVISGIIGIGAVTTAAGYYVASRKHLKD